ncbi:hypothetical protein BD289DRAFT_430382 [Coniella lustricola]|uniref:Uncharacterized protein n=1 Tax=Coniella lustricola TaxID=2025994 RepID=A0A2T3ABX8_9PEZI|nr:hypothetical protein BD289DRAFT_430382 [Coniella lustricola]
MLLIVGCLFFHASAVQNIRHPLVIEHHPPCPNGSAVAMRGCRCSCCRHHHPHPLTIICLCLVRSICLDYQSLEPPVGGNRSRMCHCRCADCGACG